MQLALPVYVHRPNPSLLRTPAASPAPRLITGTPQLKSALTVRTTITTIIQHSSAKYVCKDSYMTPSYSSATAPTISHIWISQAIVSAVLLQLFGMKPQRHVFHARVPWNTMPWLPTVHAPTALPWLLMAAAKNVQALLLSGMERNA